MTKRLVLVPHNRGSASAKRLAGVLSDNLGYRVLRVRPERVSKRVGFRLTPGTDKLTQFTLFQQAGVACPEWTTSIDTARQWITEGNTVVCRRLLRASEGRGIVIAETADQLVPAPLYTKYVKKKKEYRVHVFSGKVIDVQEKRKRKGFEEERNHKVRNLANGYVFCRDNITEPGGLRPLAVAATTALKYNIGAVDIAYNEKGNRLVVLEVNANPGMQGTTLNNYAVNIINWFKEIQNV